MKIMNFISIVFWGLLVLFCPRAEAHFAWINLDNYNPEPGGNVQITIGWGHRYPLSGFLKQADLESIYLLNPAGKKESVLSVSELQLEPENGLGSTGPYVVAAQRKTGFYTKTAHGGKRQSKEGLSDVIKCYRSHMSMKAILNAGQGREEFIGRVEQPLEIIPLVNPADLRAGDYLPLEVMLHGKPFKGMIYATYMGFSTEKNVFAYTTRTDSRGRGMIRILQPGIWLLKAEYEQPYPDRDVCDVESFVATLTLEVK